MKAARGIAVCALLLAVLFSVTATHAKRRKPTPDELKYAQEQMKKLEEEKKKLEAEHLKLEAAREAKLHQLYENEQNLNEHENHLTRLQQNMQQLEIQRNWLKAELKRTEDNLGQLGASSRVRVVNLYKEGSKPVLAFLLESKDGTDFFDRLYYSKLLVNQDLSMLDVLRNTEAKLERLRGLYQDKTAAVENASAKVRTEREQLKVERGQLDAQKKQIESDTANNEAQQTEIDKNEEEFNSIIRQNEERDLVFNGRFYPPLRGGITVTSPFGMRRHPLSHIRRMHNGADLRAATGTPVYAAAAGKVIKAAWFGGFGNVVIIQHGTYRGHEYSTIYGHNQKIEVEEGEMVDAGDEIALSDNTGYSAGPHLHFEIRIDGEPVNPLRYIHEGDELP